jgi:hypothetical protein
MVKKTHSHALFLLFDFFFVFFILEILKKNKIMLEYMEEMSVMGKKTSSKCKEHTYAQCKEACVGYGHLGECFLLGIQVSNHKGKIARLETDENA